jgi:hypothetical protein
MSCEIISLADRQKVDRRISIRAGNPLLDDPADTLSTELEPTARERPQDGISETLKNKNLRDARKRQWSRAEATREYWRACLDMESAISIAQSRGLPEGANHLPHNPDDRWTILAKWRLAVAAQLLALAPDTRAIAWKKAALAGGQHRFTDVKSERIERAIADDAAWLAAHPTRAKKGGHHEAPPQT